MSTQHANGKLKCQAVEVTCRLCGETVPEPTSDSLFWTMDELRRMDGKGVACACGARVRIHVPNSVPTF